MAVCLSVNLFVSLSVSFCLCVCLSVCVVKVSERTSSGPLPFLSAKKEFVELESLRGMVMSLLVSSTSWLIICVTSHYKAGRNIANPVNVKFPNLTVIKEEKKGGKKGENIK